MALNSLTATIGHLLPEPHAGLLAGMLFGTRETMPQWFHEALVTTGTLHIIALSGFNISLIGGLVSVTLARVVSKYVALVLTIILTIGFILFVGPSPSIVRAGMMGSFSMLALLFGKQRWPFFALVVTAAIMALLSPEMLGNISFQLSVTSTLGLILFAAPGANSVIQSDGSALRSLLRAFGKTLWDDLRLTLAAQVFTVPIIYWYFHRISLISPLANVFVGWLVAPITIGGYAMLACAYMWRPVGQIAAWFIWVPLQYFVWIIMVCAQVPMASIGK